jgi:hypothetical protein
MTFVFLSFGFVSNFGFRVSRFVRSWRPLPRGIPTRQKIYRFRREVIPRGESHPLSDLFLYLWIVFVYHEAHEDHEEFTIKLYRSLRFKARGRYNLIDTSLSWRTGVIQESKPRPGHRSPLIEFHPVPELHLSYAGISRTHHL